MNPIVIPMVLLFALPAHAIVTIDWITVGNPGNAGDTAVMTCCGDGVGTSGYGAVSYEYRIAKFEVTNAQYSEFLNAVATTDTHTVYDVNMGSGFRGGILRTGTSGSFSYTPIAGREDLPVNYVSFFNTMRFANWLHNGQPSGAQDASTTEDGAYSMTAESYPGTVSRNAGARVFLPSEDEW
jgi:hypothetical protein